jgi:hypothetical protein
MEKDEKARLAQLGLDRRLAEAVGALDNEAATFTRIAGDENAEEADVMQAASNYRAAVQRRNIAYDRACGVPEDQAGQAGAAEGKDSIRAVVAEAIDGMEPPKATVDEDALNAAVEAEIAKRLPGLVEAAVDKATTADGSEKPPAEEKPAPSGGSGKSGGGSSSSSGGKSGGSS